MADGRPTSLNSKKCDISKMVWPIPATFGVVPNFAVWQDEIWHRAIFRGGQTVAEIWRFIIFSIWRPSAILDLLCASLDHPRRVFSSLYRCTKFGWNRCSTFDNMHDFKFRPFGLKMPTHDPKIGVLMDMAPYIGRHINETSSPKGYMTYRSSKLVHQCDLCAWRRDQKDKERNQMYSVKLGIRRDNSCRLIEMKWNEILRDG